jgi:hypothetical protein
MIAGLLGAAVLATTSVAAYASPIAYTPTTTPHTRCAGYNWYYHQGVPGLGGFATCYFDQGNLAGFGNSRLVFQPDGNLVIYAIDSGQAAWSSNSHNRGGTRLEFQADGNLVIYNANGYGIWSSNTWASCNGSGYQKILTFQQDGNLVIYCTYQNTMSAIWATHTWIR